MRPLSGKKGQALLELAVFGAIILMIFAYLLSYMQRLNDQQYVQMDAFRNALQMANYGTGDNKGSSVHFTQLENKRNVDLSGYYRKGSLQTNSASASVFWGVPEVNTQAQSQTFYKINEDLVSLASGQSVDDIASTSNTDFAENVIKKETTAGIINTRTSSLKDTVTTTLVDKDNNPIKTVTQGLYRDTDGTYKYKSAAVGQEVVRSKTWETNF